MKNLSISKKLIVGFGIILVMILTTIGMSIYSMNGINGQISSYAKYTLPNSTSIWIIRRNIVSVQRYLARALSETDTQKNAALFDLAQQDYLALSAEIEKYAGNQRDNSRDEKIAELRGFLEEAVAARKKMAELLTQTNDKNFQLAKEIFESEYLPPFEKMTDILVDFSDTAEERAATQERDAAASVQLAWIILTSCGVAAVVLSVLLTVIIRKSILTPVNEIVDAYGKIAKGHMKASITYESRDELGQMATLIQSTNMMQSTILEDVIEKFTKISQGDLRLRVDLEYPGDYAILKQTIENTVSTLNNTMQTINTAAEQVNTGASQVSSGAQALAAGSTEQASSVEELTVSIGKIAEQATENSTNVKIANQHVEQAGTGVNAGNEHMVQLTEAMTDIGAASTQIANITKVIEDIAFQTNILALNAAIEAARAGNAGKGFAVVAEEVRNLAGKSAEAAKQTGELIRNSVITVSKGTQITAQTAQILQDVGKSTLKVTESFAKIEQASAEQANAIEQIKQGLTQVSSVVQTNAATAEENSATSEEMSVQAATLREEVGKFKLDTQSNGISAIPFVNNLSKIKKPGLEGSSTLEKY